MDPVANGLHTSPARRGVAEQASGDIEKAIDLAVPGGKEELQGFRGKVFDGQFAGVWAGDVGFAGVLHERRIRQAELARRRNEAGADIPERILINVSGHGRGDSELVWFEQARSLRRMHVEQSNHGYRRWNVELNVVAKPDQHRGIPWKC